MTPIRPGHDVSFSHPADPARELAGYLVMPAATPAPGVLILHEVFGLNDNMRDIADRFAAAGYAALAADLFSDGNKTVCMFRAFYGLFLTPLNNGTLRKVRAAFEYLQRAPGVDSAHVGAIGFCMGGSFALQLACVEGNLRAVHVVSGQNPRPRDAIARACPLVGSYAEKDFMARAGRQLDLALDRHNIPHDIKVYPDGIHSMFNDRASGHNPAVADDAWGRTIAFFGLYLRA